MAQIFIGLLVYLIYCFTHFLSESDIWISVIFSKANM